MEGSSNTVAREIVKLIQTLYNLISLTYWWPTVEVDGEDCVEYVSGSDQDKYILKLQKLSADYVSTVNNTCDQCPELKTHFDKPNLHRLLELYRHSVPKFGHAREFAELVFEHAHQPLKRAIVQGNHKDEQLFAVDRCVAKDWHRRVTSLYHESKSSSTHEALSDSKKSLRALMFGRSAHYVMDEDLDSQMDREITRQFHRSVQNVIKNNAFLGHFASLRSSILKGTGGKADGLPDS